MDHIDFDTAASKYELQRKYGNNVGNKVWQYYGSEMSSAAADVLDQLLMTQFDSMLGPTREQRDPGQLLSISGDHRPGEATVNAITMSEQRSVEPDVRGSGVADRVHAVVRAGVSVNAAKARSDTNTSTTTRLQSSNTTDNRVCKDTRQQGKQTLKTAKPELVGTRSWEHAATKAGAQVKKECAQVNHSACRSRISSSIPSGGQQKGEENYAQSRASI